MRKLSDKQKRFINEYLIDTNATQAAIRAGYSQKSARYAARDLLARQQIKDEIQDRLAILDKAKVCIIQEVMEYITAVMRGETTSTVIVVCRPWWRRNRGTIHRKTTLNGRAAACCRTSW